MKFESTRVRRRLKEAVEDLATGKDKLKKRVLDAYETHLSHLVAQEFPNQETLQTFEAIETKITAIKDRIEQKPEYEFLLRHGFQSRLEIAKHSLDSRVARSLAKLITKLYFDIEDCL